LGRKGVVAGEGNTQVLAGVTSAIRFPVETFGPGHDQVRRANIFWRMYARMFSFSSRRLFLAARRISFEPWQAPKSGLDPRPCNDHHPS